MGSSPSTVQVSKKEVIWFASGILFGMITVMCCLELIFLLSSNELPNIPLTTTTTTTNIVVPIRKVGGSTPGTIMVRPMETAAVAALAPLNSFRSIISPRMVSTTAIVDVASSHQQPSTNSMNATKPALLHTIATIALAELGVRLVLRCIIGLPFRLLASGARRASPALNRRFLTPMLRGGTRSMAKTWQMLIKLYYKTSLSKIINRGKRFVKMLVSHEDHHHDATTVTVVDDDTDDHHCIDECHLPKQSSTTRTFIK